MDDELYANDSEPSAPSSSHNSAHYYEFKTMPQPSQPASVAIQEAFMVHPEEREGRFLLISSSRAEELATNIRVYKKIAL